MKKLIGQQSEKKEGLAPFSLLNVYFCGTHFYLYYLYYMCVFLSSCLLKICKSSLWVKWMFIIKKTVACCIGLMHFMLQLLVILQYTSKVFTFKISIFTELQCSLHCKKAAFFKTK